MVLGRRCEMLLYTWYRDLGRQLQNHGKCVHMNHTAHASSHVQISAMQSPNAALKQFILARNIESPLSHTWLSSSSYGSLSAGFLSIKWRECFDCRPAFTAILFVLALTAASASQVQVSVSNPGHSNDHEHGHSIPLVDICKSEGSSASLVEGLLKPAFCAAKTEDNIVMLGVADRWNSRSMLPLFLASLRLSGKSDRHFIVWTIDRLAYDDCTIFHHYPENCIFEESIMERESSPRTTWGNTPFFELVWRKTTVAATILQWGFGVIALDIDLIFFKDPLEYARSLPVKDITFQRQDLVLGPDYMQPQHWVNAGFYYARPTAKTNQFMDQWLEKDHGMQEQAMLNEVLKTIGVPDEHPDVVDWALLPDEDNVNHCGDNSFGDIGSLEEEFHKHIRGANRWTRIVFVHLCCVFPRSMKEAFMAMVLKQGSFERHMQFLQ